jgi:hypothetical protein
VSGRGVLVELGGKTLTLRFDYNSIADLEEKAGVGAEVLFTEQRAGLHLLRLLIWAGLRHEDRNLTPRGAGSLMQQYIADGGNLEDLVGKVTEALEASELWGNRGNARAGAAEMTE